MVVRCNATTAAGSPCSAQPVRDDGYCYWHSPSTASDRADARRRGGRNRSNAVRAKKELAAAATSDDLLLTLTRIIDKAEKGAIEAGIVNCISGAARTMNELRKTTEIEARLAELESRAALASGRRFG